MAVKAKAAARMAVAAKVKVKLAPQTVVKVKRKRAAARMAVAAKVRAAARMVVAVKAKANAVIRWAFILISGSPRDANTGGACQFVVVVVHDQENISCHLGPQRLYGIIAKKMIAWFRLWGTTFKCMIIQLVFKFSVIQQM